MFTISRQFASPNHDSREGADIRVILLHATVGDFASARSWLCSPSSRVSSHYLISKNCEILQLVPDERRAWHAGVSSWRGEPNVNNFSIGVELEHSNNPSDPYPQPQLDALRWLVRGLLDAYHLTPADITTHAAVALPAKRKTDPAGFPLELFRASLTRYSPDSPLLGTPLAPALRFSGPRGEYTAWDVRVIVNAYWTQSLAVGLDPILAFAQCLHETARLSSFWSQRPRRNPAGIGVTGKIRSTAPAKADRDNWAYNEHTRFWYAGRSFKTWMEYAIPAHLGRLLRYALPRGAGTPDQQRMMSLALAVRPLPEEYWGCAPTLQGLEHTWAEPGDNYADAIARHANALLEATQ